MQINKVAVLGAGIMGAGIAQVAAQGGYSVVLRDLHFSLAQEGMKTIEKNLDRLISKAVIDEKEKEKIMHRITPTTDLAQIYDADIIIEAVVENMAVKKQLFAELDNMCRQDAVLATNTSSLSITEIASATKHPERVIGMHFFNPVPAMQLVEIVKGMETDEKTVEIASYFVSRIGKEKIVISRESPGFVVNRILVPYINEAIFIYAEGLAQAEEIDLAMKLGAGMPVGPLELADMIGLDTVYAVILSFYHEFRDTKYRPHPLLATMVRAGHLGKKSGRGFYVYS
ncbi:3-hydroxyacyl-CoA dehydrogenase [Thermosyntropha lipolytica DSM 11003]|uniref:3-hydroxybutyryl-CoA dehydrogenase n=1 Tax=Thermosyntropha lipolytica DSM 11003 TaxID=1123382 RepID=A0A1M5LBE3_9FIRM|nr:3-hydroxybutyryl-CoA dehydrogenase [Thermosyntropha lipolytica]SHG62255.1 3-hydroxyacyl-CoA dehydrogenase [Thermosyntropha lipolytica DSM 11003]